MKKFSALILGLSLSTAYAEIITVPAGPTGEHPADTSAPQPYQDVDRSGLPQRGMLKEQVRARYGEPTSVTAPVGDPPISRWTYDDFVVFFEYKHVINAVIPNKPRRIYNQDELRRGDDR